ncbi:MAG: glycoside hydrolase family 43 protein [Planctomycetaceae bacterium]|jgi:hypothetical protein|nr:glycoside hydrolase family 43 protein [Planctomycetaceae bacterium]
MRPFIFCVLLFAVPCFGGETENVYLFSYFVNNGEDGLHLAYSTDGLDWKPLNDGKSFLAPPKNVSTLMRDPSIVRAPDGTFHLVWTGSWTGKSIGYASSKDLIEWTNEKSVPVMENEPKTRNVWAPEIFYDKDSQTYYIIWSSTIPDKFTESAGSSETDYNHRLYCTTTKDFHTFTQTKPYWNPNHNVIDAFLTKAGGQYLLFYKDETLKPEAKKNILLATGTAPAGTFDVHGVISHTNWVEGPSALKIKDEWFIYYDCYTKNRYGAVRSKDLKHWENVSDEVHFPAGTRHGTAFEVDASVLKKIQAAQ